MRCDVCGRFTGIAAGAVVLTRMAVVGCPWEGIDEDVLCARCFDLNGGAR